MVNILVRLALFAASCWLPGLSLSSALAQVTQASPVVATVATRPVELRGLRQTFRRGQPMGKYKQGVFCGPFGGKLEWDTSWNWNRRFNSEDFYRLFHEEVQAAGFRIAGLRTGFFDQGDGVRAEHMVAGTIDGLNLNLCYPYRQLGNIDSVQGNGTVHVSWEIFSKAENKVVATLQTEGSGRQSDYVSSGDYEIILAGFRDSVRKLVASPEFKAAFVGEPTKPSFTESVRLIV